MKLHEYQGKEIFAKYGVPVPAGRVAASPDEAMQIAQELGKTVVVKAQVHTGGRGKAGGIKLAKTPEEARAVATQILGMDIKGFVVDKVLVEEAADIREEYYLGITTDRAARRQKNEDRVRADMSIELYGWDPRDATRYDLVVNTGRLDLDACVEIIAQACRTKLGPSPGRSS